MIEKKIVYFSQDVAKMLSYLVRFLDNFSNPELTNTKNSIQSVVLYYETAVQKTVSLLDVHEEEVVLLMGESKSGKKKRYNYLMVKEEMDQKQLSVECPLDVLKYDVISKLKGAIPVAYQTLQSIDRSKLYTRQQIILDNLTHYFSELSTDLPNAVIAFPLIR